MHAAVAVPESQEGRMIDIVGMVRGSQARLDRVGLPAPESGRVADLLYQAWSDCGAVLTSTRSYSSLLAEAVFHMRAEMDMASSGGRRPVDLALDDDLEARGRTSYADPTGQAAIRTSTARQQHRDLLHAIGVLYAAAGRCAVPEPELRDARTAASKADYVLDLSKRWCPRPPTVKERAETEGDNEPGCVSCARTEVVRGVRRWEPALWGDLCRWCYDWKRATGEAPSVELVRAHHDGKRIMRKAS